MPRQDLFYSPDDPFNPYDAPQTPIGSIPTLSGGPTIPFSLDSIMSRSWALFRARMGLCIAIYGLGFLISFASQYLVGMVTSAAGTATSDQSVLAILNFGVTMLTAVFGLWIGLGQSLGYLKLAKDLPASLGDIFAGGPYIVTMVLASFLFGAIFTGIMMLGAIPGIVTMAIMGSRDLTSLLVLGLGLIVAVAFLSVYWVSLSQILYVIIDNPGLGAIGSLKESVRITKGRFWGISLVYLVAMLINLMGLLALGVGLVFTVPFTFLMLAVMYTALAPESLLTQEKLAPSLFD